MLVQPEFLKKVKTFGLNSYEAKIWTALLTRGVSTAGELSDIANVPRSRSYDVLESLEKKGFIIMKIGKPIKYIAVPPMEVLERVKKRIQESADSQIVGLEEVRGSDVLKELEVLHSQGVEMVEPSDITASVKGRDNIYDHMDMMIKTANESVILVTSDEGLVRKYEAMKRSLKKASERDVKIRIAAPLTKKSETAFKELSKIAEMRVLNNLSARFCVIDQNQLMFMLLDDSSVHPTYDVGVWVNTALFSNAMKDLFELAWVDMKTYTLKN